MTQIDSVVLDAPDPSAADAFYAAVLGPDAPIRVRRSPVPTPGFRGFVLSLVVSQPDVVDLYVRDALAAGAVEVKPVAKSLWGYGGVVRAPDGALWKVATSSKKNSAPPVRVVDDFVLLVGASDVKASKRFYVEHGLAVKRSFGGKYCEFEAEGSRVTLALYGRRALAKDAGVADDDSQTRGIAIAGGVAPFTDPDGLTWEPARVSQPA